MEGFFSRERPQKLDGEAKAAVERGEAVPTIATAIGDGEAFPYLLAEIRKMPDADRKQFAEALAATERVLDIDDPVRFGRELEQAITKTLGFSAAGSLAGVAILWVITGGALNVPLMGAVGIGTFVTQAMNYLSGYKKDDRRREAMHGRAVKLKEALLQ